MAFTDRLGVEESDGMVRVGVAHYNTASEVDRLLAVVNDLPYDESMPEGLRWGDFEKKGICSLAMISGCGLYKCGTYARS